MTRDTLFRVISWLSVLFLVILVVAAFWFFESLSKQAENTQGAVAQLEEQLVTSTTQVQNLRKELEETKRPIPELTEKVDLLDRRLANPERLVQRLPLPISQGSKPITGQRPSKETYLVPEVARLYDFPTELDGNGQCIGLIELDGGYNEPDLQLYFTKLKLPKPKVTPVSVDGAKNNPGQSWADGQVLGDIQIAGAVAPGAHLVVYFTTNSELGFLHAVIKAIDDQENRPSVLAISWGFPETSWTKSAMDQLNQALQRAAVLGITVVCAAGNLGVTAGVADGKARVDFPASSPWVLACGGTRLRASGDRIISEVGWNSGPSATGGGVSEIFARPDWQSGVQVPSRPRRSPGRGLPDVAANGDPASGYILVINGQQIVLGGTSTSTALWAGLIALINQGVGRNVGYLNPVLYTKLGPAGVLHDVAQGNNSVPDKKGYSAAPGWNAYTGWGSPNGKKLLEALRSSEPARNK